MQPGQILPSDYFLVAAFILSALFRPGLITRITDETFFLWRENKIERRESSAVEKDGERGKDGAEDKKEERERERSWIKEGR